MVLELQVFVSSFQISAKRAHPRGRLLTPSITPTRKESTLQKELQDFIEAVDSELTNIIVFLDMLLISWYFVKTECIL